MDRKQTSIDDLLDLSQFGITFSEKPVIVGGTAMEYYGLRKRGHDIDLIVNDDDYQVLAKKYPEHKKDIWGDFGIEIYGYELFRSIWRLDYNFYSEDSIEFDSCKVLSIHKLLLMKVMAIPAGEKHQKDVGLIVEHFLRNQNPEYKKYLDENVDKYLSVPGGIIYGAQNK